MTILLSIHSPKLKSTLGTTSTKNGGNRLVIHNGPPSTVARFIIHSKFKGKRKRRIIVHGVWSLVMVREPVASARGWASAFGPNRGRLTEHCCCYFSTISATSASVRKFRHRCVEMSDKRRARFLNAATNAFGRGRTEQKGTIREWQCKVETVSRGAMGTGTKFNRITHLPFLQPDVCAFPRYVSRLPYLPR